MGLLVRRVLHRCRPGFAPCVQLVIHQSARAGQAPSGSKSLPYRNAVHATVFNPASQAVCVTQIPPFHFGCGWHLQGRSCRTTCLKLNEPDDVKAHASDHTCVI